MRATAGRVLGVTGAGLLLALGCALLALVAGEQPLDLGEAFTDGTTAHTIRDSSSGDRLSTMRVASR